MSWLTAEDIFLDQKFKDYESCLRFLATNLQADNLVDSHYIDELLKREVEYPTGLCFPKVNLALPHTDYNPKHSRAIRFVRLSMPIMCRRMDRPDETVPILLVMLVVPDSGEEQLRTLQRIIPKFKDDHIVEEILTAKDPQTVVTLLGGEYE